MPDLDQLAVAAGATADNFAPFNPKSSIAMTADFSGGRGYDRTLTDAAIALYDRLRRDEGLCAAIGQPVLVNGKRRGDVPDLSRVTRDQALPALKTLLHSLARIASAPTIRHGKGIRRQSCVAIPMDRGVFNKGQEFAHLNYAAFKGFVFALVQFGWLDMVPARYDAKTGTRNRTCVRPTAPFFDWMVQQGLVFQYHPRGVKKARALAEGDLLQVSRRKPSDRKKQSQSRSPKATRRKLEVTKEKQALPRPLEGEEKILPDLNAALMKQNLACPITSYRQYEALYDFAEGKPRFLLGGQKSVYRVFSEEDGRAGRLYGHWVQRLPKEFRKQLLINGKPTAELDYGGMQMALLYARTGRPMPEIEDLYAVPRYRREDMKAVLVRSVGTRNRSATLAALREMLQEEGRHCQGREAELYDAFWGFHEGLSPHQHGTEAVWAELQALDSRLALRVLGRLLEQGVTAIPIHDSFVVEARYADLTAEVMKLEFSTMFPGSAATVKAD